MRTIQQAARALRLGAVSSRELVEEALGKIRRLDPHLRAFITVTEEHAVARARLADDLLRHGHDLGPLHGIPYALKDMFCTRGVRTTCGSLVFRDFVPQRNAAVQERLEAAGAVLLGKTNMHELAYGITSSNPHFGAVRNPWDPSRIPGGSSGGSGAAVAAGIGFFALGSDTGGSIRIPASFCGVVGLKPTYGRVSRYGAQPLDFTLDHMGPLTRSVRDAALVLQAIAGHDERDDTSAAEPVASYLPPEQVDIRGVKVGVPARQYFDRLEDEVRQGVQQALGLMETLGAALSPVPLPDLDELNAVSRVILLAEASAVMSPYLSKRELFGADVLALLDQGCLLPAADYVNAQRLRRLLIKDFAAAMRKVDLLVTPTTPTTAPPVGARTVMLDGQPEDVRLASTRPVRGINLLGLPALSLPCSLSSAGLPVGLQLIAKPFAEPLLLRVAAALEDALALPLTPPESL